MSDDLTPAELVSWLEWAGSNLLSISVPRLRPSGHRVYWPDIPPEPFFAYGYNPTRLRPSPPQSRDITTMDEVLALIQRIPPSPAHIRRIVQARSLVSPLNGRHLYQWVRIAAVLDLKPRATARLHQQGIEKILATITPAEVRHFRQSLHISVSSA